MLTALLQAPTPQTVDLRDWITIAAIIVGPIFAVVTQLIWNKTTKEKDNKRWVFEALMSNRGSPLNPDFVRAANYIDVAFYKDKKIRDGWSRVLEHLCSDAYKPENFTSASFERFRDLLAQLLADMAKRLGYEFDYTFIKEKSWNPSSHGVAFEENAKLRSAALRIVEGTAALNVFVHTPPTPPPPPPVPPGLRPR